jgi:hypothetical protein
MRERANLAFDHLLGDFDGGFTEGSSVLGTHLCPHSQIGRVITVGHDCWSGVVPSSPSRSRLSVCG